VVCGGGERMSSGRGGMADMVCRRQNESRRHFGLELYPVGAIAMGTGKMVASLTVPRVAQVPACGGSHLSWEKFCP
jgi:hypothetical protein